MCDVLGTPDVVVLTTYIFWREILDQNYAFSIIVMFSIFSLFPFWVLSIDERGSSLQSASESLSRHEKWQRPKNEKKVL